MRRLLLLIVLALVTWYYFPETRAILMDVLQPIVVPIVRWSAEEEMSQIARNVVEHERLTRALPAQGEWLRWLDARYISSETTTDPWGSTYQLQVTRDSVTIVSYGPDRTWRTADDFGVSAPRG